MYCESIDPINGSDYIFGDITYSTATLYVPALSVEKYKETSPWKNFQSIIGVDFSGVDEISVDINTPVEVYNLNGVKVGDSTEDLQNGFYIVRQGNSVKKIAVK